MNKIKKLYIHFIAIIVVLPLLFMIIWSLTGNWSWPNLLPDTLNLRGFSYAFSSLKSFKILLSSILLSSLVTVITLLISIPAARAMAYYNFPGKGLVNLLILLPLIVPMITVVMGIHINFIRWGLANTFMGVVLVHVLPGIPYAVRIMQNTFEISGQKIELQGKVLGASSFQVFRYISLPLMKPGLIVAGTMVYILSFSQYFITFLIGGGKVLTYSMFIFPFVESGDRTMASALSFLFVVSIFIVLFVSDRIVGNYYKKSNQFII